MKNNLYLWSLILSLVLSFQTELYSQFSPGDLSNAHSNLEGMSNCFKCHTAGDKVPNSKCLDCHTQIQNLQNNGRGYHSNSEVTSKTCITCHSEHHGRNFQLIRFDSKNFDHNKTGYKLTGKHESLKCESCHQSKNIANADLKKKGKTFLGLEKNCASCHTDIHSGTLGKECQNCHSVEGFVPAKGFDHNKAAFVLTGAHKRVDCSKCHRTEKINGKDVKVFKGISFFSCQSCHKDIHEGKFGADCTSCHNTESFSQVRMANFDHGKTTFPLLGAHTKVKCSSCHGDNLLSKPKHELCTDCHSDYHSGEFTEGEIVKNCAECHSINSFSPANFTIEKHSKLRFPLLGAHLATPCTNCHLKEEKWKFKKTEISCISCHTDFHGEELSKKYMPGDDCQACHNNMSWNTVKFDHNLTGFNLLGVHSKLECKSCHFNQESNKFLFASVSGTCKSCHNDVHLGQFESDKNENVCIDCHSFENWQPSKFSHQNTKFPLTGAHSKLECSKCHKTGKIEDKEVVIYKIENFLCASCHF